MKKEFKDLCISKDATMLQAMEQMDRVRHKLLMVMEGESFMGLLSIGAIQRAIVRGISPKSSIGEILRKDIVVCKVGDSDEKIKAEMLKCRAEYMPIVQPRNTLNTRDGDEVVDVVFWEDLFEEAMHTRATVGKYDLPVVVMAGGEGTRLRPLTNILPKPLLPIGKKTIIESIMDRFVEIGSRRFFISLNYMADTIERYLAEHNDGRYEFTFFREDRPMGSGGSLSLIRDKIKEPFFVTNCDNILQQDLAEIVEVHRQNRNEMTVVAAVKSMKLPYGNLVVGKDEQVVNVEEKPEFLFRVNTGVYVMEPGLLNEVPDGRYFPITDLMNIIIKRGGRVGCFPITDGSWCDIGNWGDYTKALGR
ncbi:MAG: NTP transferase domain-containing protein [Kiritimatiellae bacterium]|nr:NTP transferase domain-containing protein [Kiritimatiellia bacterium]